MLITEKIEKIKKNCVDFFQSLNLAIFSQI